ncbi:MAG: division/cell wall cluster transcriptional repressor MraZ [Lachnospiraceae bacterium]|nr:division/cell wall cluster transcriptional repressor MraZ [Lachnospiraceae bacterium]
MFMGEYGHVLDPKNRVIIPARFREGLEGKFIITSGLDGCLYLLTMKAWESFVEQLAGLPFTKQTREFRRFFTQNAAEAEIDNQGRVLIPQNLKALAGIDKDVVFVGVIDKIELWAKERLDESQADDSMENIAERMSTEFGLRL